MNKAKENTKQIYGIVRKKNYDYKNEKREAKVLKGWMMHLKLTGVEGRFNRQH